MAGKDEQKTVEDKENKEGGCRKTEEKKANHKNKRAILENILNYI